MSDADFSVYATIKANTTQFEKGIKNAQSSINSMSKSIEGIQKLIKTAFSMVGVTVGIKAVADFGKSCVQSANQASKAFNILDNTVRATGADAWTSTKELESASKALSDSTNYSVTEIQKMQSVLLGFTNITGEAFDEASDAVLDMATVMGMDLTSAVQTVGKALDDPITGLDSLRRQGFKFTDEQKAELAQLVKNGKRLEAQKIILDTLATSYGGASKAGQDSFAKQRHSVENFSDTLGTKLIPVMQVFAENNSKMINSLTDVISKMDFTPVVNVVTNLSKIFNTAFENIFAYLKKGANEVSDFISRFNFKPIISVLDGLLGGLSEIISKFKEINSQKLEIFDKLKEALIDFSNSETFQNIVNFVNKIIDAVFFLWSEIQDITNEIKNLVVNKIIEIWGKIKELFQNGQNALSESGQDIASWGDLFYNILNNAFRSFQDFFGMIKALIHGDWAVAWEYAKLTVMRVADNILDLISTIANAFPNLINGMIEELNKLITEINKVRGWFGKDPLGLISAFESVDLSKKSGLEDKIKETENKIQELTGKSADITIQNLESVSTKFAGFTQHALGEIGKLTEGVGVNSEKQKQYFAGTFSSSEKETESTYEKFSEWDSKLLQQRLEDLDEWSDEYHEIQLALIAEEKKKAEEADKTGAETEKINKYYNKQIEKENERAEKAKRNKAKETMKIIISTLSNIAKNAVNVFKKVAGTISNFFSSVISTAKNIFSTIKNIFSNLFEFNVDDALNSLLAVEDAILTFFVETLPRLPNFFESAFSSVLILIQTLINSIDWEKVKTILDSIIKTFITYAPQILSGIVELFSGLVASISSTLIENAPDIISAIGEMFFTILEALPGLISNFLKVAGTYLSEIGKYITENGERLTKDLTDIVSSIVEGISNFIESGGWKNILSAILTIQKAIENAVTENLPAIVDTIIEALPDLVQFLIDSIVSASKTLAKAIKPILKLIVKLIEAIVNVMFSDEVLDASMEVVEALFEALTEVAIEVMPKVLPKLIAKLIKVAIRTLASFPVEIAKAFITGISKAFGKTNWGQFVKDLFSGFIDGIKELFGIHSPSTLFESFGWYMVEGLVNGLKGISEATMAVIQPFLDFIENTFNTTIGGVIDNVKSIVDGFVTLGTTSFDAIKDIIDTIANASFDTVKTAIESVTDIFKTLSELTFSSIVDLTELSFDTLKDSIDDTTTALKDITEISLKNLSDSLISLTSISFNAFNASINSVNSGLYNLANISFSGLISSINTVSSSLYGIINISFSGLTNSISSVSSSLYSLANISFNGLKSSISSVSSSLYSLANISFNGLKSSISSVNSGLYNLASISFNGLTSSMNAVSSGVVAINNSITNLINSLSKLVSVANQAVSAINPLSGGGSGSSVKTALVDLLVPFGFLQHFATGTQQAQKGMALVGEAGPELVKFNGGEQVINSHNTQKALEGMGGTVVNQNVTFNNLQDTTAFAMIQQLKQYNRQMAINGII